MLAVVRILLGALTCLHWKAVVFAVVRMLGELVAEWVVEVAELVVVGGAVS